jgi:UPF0716 protein FxsA
MAILLALVFFALPIAEIAALVAVGDLIGILPTILALVVLSIAGAVLAKRQGIKIWQRFHRAISQGRIPSGEIVDGTLVLLGAALLLTPGFITDVLGMILLIPASRSVVKGLAVKGSGWWIGRRFGLTGIGRPDMRAVKVTAARWRAGTKSRTGTNGTGAPARVAVPAGEPAGSQTSALQAVEKDSSG